MQLLLLLLFVAPLLHAAVLRQLSKDVGKPCADRCESAVGSACKEFGFTCADVKQHCAEICRNDQTPIDNEKPQPQEQQLASEVGEQQNQGQIIQVEQGMEGRQPSEARPEEENQEHDRQPAEEREAEGHEGAEAGDHEAEA